MNEITIDTVKLNQIGKDIEKKVQELMIVYQNALDLLYSIRDNKYWSGFAADTFFNKVAIDNKNYLRYFNSLSKFGTNFCNIAQRYETLAGKYRVIK